MAGKSPRGGGGGGESGGAGGGSGGAARAGSSPAAKTFTVAGANATLPLVRVIVKDAMEKWRELGKLRAELADAEVHNLTEKKKRQTREEVERIEHELEGCVREVAELGASIKDFETGLVDFPMKHGSRTILLCWRAGEAKITHWHDVDAGFAGRRPIEELER